MNSATASSSPLFPGIANNDSTRLMAAFSCDFDKILFFFDDFAG
jgi:hypothetical protein